MPASASTICRRDEAQKTGEWRDGIGRLLDADSPADAAALICALSRRRARLQPPAAVSLYPGSPATRAPAAAPAGPADGDRASSSRRFALKTRFAGDYQVRVIELDGWLALGAHLPPKEKRGLVLVDPPFEKEGEFDRLVDGLCAPTRAGRAAPMRCGIRSRTASRGRLPRMRLRDAASRRSSTSSFEIRAPPSTDGSTGRA